MPKMKRVIEEVDRREPVSVSSVLFGLVMIIALIVALAALMGGSLSRVETRLANTLDATARAAGLAVESVAVIGLEHDPELAAQVRAAAMVEPGENMWRANPHRIAERVDATRKVARVRVHRLWPDQIVIMAEPARPMALHEAGGTWQVIDTLGRAMPAQLAAEHADLPRIAGKGAPAAAATLIAALNATPEVGGALLRAERIAERRWDLHIAGGLVVRLPEDDHLPAALDQLAGLELRTALLERRLSRIDLRVQGRVFLAPPQVPAIREEA